MAETHFKAVTPDETIPEIRPTDWKCCFIYQVDDGTSNLVSPSKRLGYVPEKSFYPTTASILFHWIKDCPDGLERRLYRRLQEYKDADELKQSLVDNQASFHKVCISKYDGQKLKRKQWNSSEENKFLMSPPKATRRSIPATTFTAACFFCEGKENLIMCETLTLDNNVRKMVEVMGDSKLLSKLAAGDMPATEAAYHKACIPNRRNRYRLNKRISKSVEIRKEVEGLALSAVVDWMNQSNAEALDENHIPVYALKTVFEMYMEKLRSYGASEEWVEVAYRTRFKESLLKSVQGIIEITTGNSIMITLDGELGKALFQACLYSNADDSAVITENQKGPISGQTNI